MAGFSVPRYGPERGAWGRLTARDSLVRRLDWPLLGSAVALSLIGSILVYSATRGGIRSPTATRTTSSSGTPSTPASASP